MHYYTPFYFPLFIFFLRRLAEGQIYSRDVRINEYMDIFCPQFDMDTPEENMLQFVIYNVSEEAFIDCNFDQSK